MNTTPRNQVIHEKLKAVYANDTVKSVFAPFHTLASEVINHIPSVEGAILVLSDCGLLVALCHRLKKEGLDFSKVIFVAHTEEQEELSRNLTVKTWQLGYNDPIANFKQKAMGLKFDVVIGNPPYQPGKNKAAGKRAGSAARIWHKFVEQSWTVLKDDGHLAFINPPHWRIPSTAIKSDPLRVTREIMRTHKIIWLQTGCETYFNLTIGIDAYVVMKRKTANHFTNVKFHKNGDRQLSVDLQKIVLPTICDQMAFDIITKVTSDAAERIKLVQSPNTHEIAERNTNVSRLKTDMHTVPMLANIFGGAVNEDKLVWSSIPHPLQSNPKVLVPNHGRYISFPVEEGKFGLSIGIAAVPFESLSEAQEFGSWMNSKIVKFFIKCYQDLDHFKFPTYAVELLPKLMGKIWTDKELYEYFKLSSEEIQMIESFQ